MTNRQAARLLIGFAFLFVLCACAPAGQGENTPAPATATATRIPATPTALPSPTATPLTCLSQPGELREGEVPTNGTPTAFLIYLPACYDQFPKQRYPVLYLLNGQTYTADQWVRIGAPAAADRLILSGQTIPFILVFPEDRFWNLNQGSYFGQYLLNDIIPYIDRNFRTLADREHRAIGGLSRGGGWAFRLGLTRPDLFSAVGLHSPAVFGEDRPVFESWVRAVPPELWPRLYLDVGDNDREHLFNAFVEEVLTRYGVPHEWHLNTGAHDEDYWSEHVEEYLRWYVEGWGQPQAAP